MSFTMEQVQELADRYDACGFGNTSSGRFLRGIVISGQMPRGRGIGWLNDLISKGSPQNVEPLLAELKDLIIRSKRDDTIEALSDIMRRVQAGWSLSDHKLSELERLRNQVNDDLPDLELDDRQRDLMKGLGSRKRYSSYSNWASRPVISERLNQIFDRWGKHGKVSPDDWQYTLDNFKGTVAEFESSRHPVGSLRWTRGGEPATIMSAPRFDDRGTVIINVMTPSVGVYPLPAETIMIRKPK
jgi:hypothetical protein